MKIKQRQLVLISVVVCKLHHSFGVIVIMTRLS